MTDACKDAGIEALTIDALSKTYRRGANQTHALDRVTFSVKQGELFGLLGPNGAGKSTLIGILGGIVKADSGSMRVLGVDTLEDMRRTKMAVGIVPQEITFDPFFTVREILEQQSGYYGLRKNGEWIDELLHLLGLTEKRNDKVSRLSGGMKRRVLIAQALVHRPPVIVLDEPTAGVDVELRHKLWDVMKGFHKEGHTIILTTHYLEEAQSLCERIAMMNRGKLVALDTTKNLLARFSGDRLKCRLTDGKLPVIDGVEWSHLDSDWWTAGCTGSEGLRTVLNALHVARCSIADFEMGPANLEEVFLRLTGSEPITSLSAQQKEEK